MNDIKAKIRANLYLIQIVLGVVAFVCAVLVYLGIITEAAITAVVTMALSLYYMFTGALARLNVTPDKGE